MEWLHLLRERSRGLSLLLDTASAQFVLSEDECMTDATELERLVYDWCTSESRGTDSARALAAVYASTYMDELRLLRFADLRALDDIRLKWALAMIQGYVEGRVMVPWPKAVALVALYDLFPDEFDA